MNFPSKQQLAAALALPGFENWRPHVDVPQLNRPISRPEDLPGKGRIAAVMVLIYASPSTAHSTLALTERHANLSKHASQISFPGGRQDDGETLQQTALRETHEEIGIAPTNIEVLGRMNSVYIPPSDFVVTPFVGWHKGQPDFVRAPDEVEQIIEVPLAHLMSPSTLVFGDIVRSSGETLTVPYYQVEQYKVWGATAIMLGELIERLTRVVATNGSPPSKKR
jgi:8-oxo-dGTP pyrophosphatase MutT (NUDIX family)